ncbi:MAG: hydroxysqualene dehydroxylase HpnE [Planctomycetales bacterium]
MSTRVVIVGGGLAGLAAAAALAGRGLQITLLESRPRWGGRASSFVDQSTGEVIDNCQHVALGCCTNFLHFCRSVGLEQCFQRERQLTFIGPDGRSSELRATWWPAPLHLAATFARLGYLSWSEKLRLASGLRALARTDPANCGDETFADWLQRYRQPAAVVERFWHVVLVSALSETLDRVDVGHARKVFVDSFLRNREGWEVWIPTVPLDELYGTQVEKWLRAAGVDCRRQAGVRQVLAVEPEGRGNSPKSAAEKVAGVELRSGERIEAEQVILTVPPHLVAELLPDSWRQHSFVVAAERLETAPISSVHLWFDRPITSLRHATLVGRLSQWVFNRSAIFPGEATDQSAEGVAARCYYQVVISASREVDGQPQGATIEKVVAELREIWPAAREAQLMHARLVTEHKAVISMLPGIDRNRPVQRTLISGLKLAGDWTRTGWPGTMEGAVRSGYLAAQSVLEDLGRGESLVQPDLPTSFLSRWLLGL